MEYGRESDQRKREAGIGPMDPPAPLTRTAPVWHAASFCCSSVWFRPAVGTGVLQSSLRGLAFTGALRGTRPCVLILLSVTEGWDISR